MSNITKTYPLVGKHIEVTFYDVENVIAQPLLERFYVEALRLQKIFNFYDKESELSILNKKRKLKCSKELVFVIKLSLKYSRLTKGEYDVTKGKEFLARKKGEKEIISKCSYKDIIIKERFITLKNDDVLIDLGSIAKGYIGGKLKKFLKDEGVVSGFIDLRGDMVSFGKHNETISIQHPRDEKKVIYSFNLKNESIATSGDYKQYYNNDFNKSHILNNKDLISVTVIHKNLVNADVIASAISVLGSKNLKKFSKEKYLVITKDLKIIKSKGFL